jgi:hypothetical protein
LPVAGSTVSGVCDCPILGAQAFYGRFTGLGAEGLDIAKVIHKCTSYPQLNNCLEQLFKKCHGLCEQVFERFYWIVQLRNQILTRFFDQIF